jgi:lipopolysaccharide export system permease protein
LILQFFWLWIDEFIGKGLTIGVVLEFIGYQSMALVPLAFPLAILISSLMTFGNLGESMELVAIRSAGISLLRFMRPLLIATLFIAGCAFMFANYIIPVASLKSRTLLSDIAHAKPTFDLKEGVFYDKLEGFAIKVGKKVRDTIIEDVIIYERGANSGLQDNFIVAKSGIMRGGGSGNFLELVLNDGWWYQERGNQFEQNSEFIRIGFKEYKKQVNMSSFGLRRTADSANWGAQRLKSNRQISIAMDSIRADLAKFTERTKRDVFSAFKFAAYLDSNYKKPDISKIKPVKSFDELIPDSIRTNVNQTAAAVIGHTTLNTEVSASEYKSKSKELRMHKIEWHKKLTLPVACIVLFLIGAPLGSIIRKGGLGMPLVIAIVFFVFFFFLSSMGEKAVKENALSPFGGMWIAVLILTPVALFVTYKAMRDSQLFNKDFYFRLWRMINFWS